MPDDSTTAPLSSPGSHDEGVALVLAAEDDSGWRPVIEWLARNPNRAAGLAGFLAMQRGLKAAIGPLGRPHIPGLELREEIGRGTFGVVYRAFDSVNRDVAVKVVHALGEDDRARFRFEAEAAASLDHPNVVPVFTSGESDGVPYLVMKLMPGGSLARWLHEKGPDRLLPPKQAAEIVRGIALGTHHAHQSGLIHRDLKPGNVLLDADGRPRIADFGLARPVDASVTGPAGTPAYMAPEQARGDKRLTTAVDVHALGVILFELLAGKTPFGDDGAISVLRRIESEPAPPVRSRRTGVPADLESICRRCLEKQPEHRYPSALAVAEDLGRFLAGVPVDGQTRSMMDDLRRAWGRIVPTRGIGIWYMLFVGAASTTLSIAAVQAAVLLDAPVWAGWAALACYFVGWFAITWVITVRHRHTLSTVERNSQAIQIGMNLAALATLPAQAWLSGGSVAPAFAPLFAIIGLGLFIAGGTFWGRLYLIALLEILIAALLPLVPLKLWPGLYCLTQLAVQVWVGWQVWCIDREGRRTAD